MGIYYYTVRKTKPVRFLDLRTGTPTVESAARWEFLYNGGSFGQRTDHLMDLHMESAQERWNDWKDRPEFTISGDAKSGTVVHAATNQAVWVDCNPLPGDEVGYLIDNPLHPRRRGEPKLALVTHEQFHQKGVEATLRGAGLPSVITDQDAPIGSAYVEPYYDFNTKERIKGSWLVRYWTGPICAHQQGNVRIEVEEGTHPLTHTIGPFMGGTIGRGLQIDLTPLVVDTLEREQKMDAFLRNSLEQAESEQVLRRHAQEYLLKAWRRSGPDRAEAAVKEARQQVKEAADTDSYEAIVEGAERIQKALAAVEAAKADQTEKARAYNAQKAAVARSRGLLLAARNAFFIERDEAKALRLALAHRDEPAFAFRIVEGAQWDYVHEAVDLLRSGRSFDSLGTHVSDLRTGDFIALYGNTEHPSRWVGVTGGSVWAKHFPSYTDARVANMALGLPEDQRERAFKNLRQDPADLLREREEKKAANRAAREARQTFTRR